MKQEELSLRESFHLSFGDNESKLDERKRMEYIEHNIVVNEGLLEISDDKN